MMSHSPLSLNRIAVYCGCAEGADPAYGRAAYEFGQLLGQEGIGLVYGAGNIGLMGRVAAGVLDQKGEVIGVIPRDLVEKELALDDVSELVITETMHERKQKMADLSDGYVALPGGFGTLDEWFEILTWRQLGIHFKPCGILNTNHFYDPLRSLIDHQVRQGFVHHAYRDDLLIAEDGRRLIEQMRSFQPSLVEKWMSGNQ
ncbi:MAG: TIGR00730 family Rossman fold protein [Verrucomicrobiota bacterium]